MSRERRVLEGRHVRSLEDLSAQVAHEIRNPITAAKSLVQQMGEDPTSAENVGYAKVALEELDRVERSVAHLLRYAREEDLRLAEVSLGSTWSTPRSRRCASGSMRSACGSCARTATTTSCAATPRSCGAW